MNGLANVMGKEVCQLYQLAIDGKHEEAKNLQLSLIGVNAAVSYFFKVSIELD